LVDVFEEDPLAEAAALGALAGRWFKMLREMPRCSWNWSKRVTPKKASRR
jgi:hypothetical protein